MLAQQTPEELSVFELSRLRRWVRMLEELDSIVHTYPSEVLDERRRLLNRIIFNQCASLSRAGLSLEVEHVLARYRGGIRGVGTLKS